MNRKKSPYFDYLHYNFDKQKFCIDYCSGKSLYLNDSRLSYFESTLKIIRLEACIINKLYKKDNTFCKIDKFIRRIADKIYIIFFPWCNENHEREQIDFIMEIVKIIFNMRKIKADNHFYNCINQFYIQYYKTNRYEKLNLTQEEFEHIIDMTMDYILYDHKFCEINLFLPLIYLTRDINIKNVNKFLDHEISNKCSYEFYKYIDVKWDDNKFYFSQIFLEKIKKLLYDNILIFPNDIINLVCNYL